MVGRHRSDGGERGRLGRVAGWNHAHTASGIAPTVKARTAGPTDTVTNDATGGTSAGSGMRYSPESKWESITRIEVLVGSGGVNDVRPPSLDDHLGRFLQGELHRSLRRVIGHAVVVSEQST